MFPLLGKNESMKEDSKLSDSLTWRTDCILKYKLLEVEQPVPPWELSHSL